jgi:hypothetical protein
MLDLKKRIQNLVGPHQPTEDDFSFLQPGGNDHLIQFAFLNSSDEYLELGPWDRYNLLLAELSAQTEIEFILDDDSRFATYTNKNEKGGKNVQVVMDLRDDHLIVIYFFGESKTCQKTNQKLFEFSAFSPCFLNTSALIQIAGMLESVSLLQYNFEQQPSMFIEPVVMKGKLTGNLAHQICFEYARLYEPYFCVEKIAGQTMEGTQGTISFQDTGVMQVDSSRLSDFLKMAEPVFEILKNRYQNLLENCVIQWQPNPGQLMLTYSGSPLNLFLATPIDKIAGAVKLFASGQKKLPLVGSAERVSRKLWSIKTSDLNTSEQIELEISANLIRIFLKEKSAIPLLDGVEHYIRQHISAELESNSL